MEHQLPSKSSDSTTKTVYKPTVPLKDQWETKGAVALALVTKWVELERIVLKAPEIPGRLESQEEILLMQSLISRYGTLTPKNFADAMRIAADKRQAALGESGGFPKMYLVDIEHEIQEFIKNDSKRKEAEERLQIPANVGGNCFFGEPSDALASEWPKIVEQTKLLRSLGNGKFARSRFWYGGSRQQQEDAVKVLRQMVQEMNDAGKWDLSQHQYDVLAVFSSEFFTHYPSFAGMTDGMKRPICPIQVGEIRQRLQRLAPDLSNFPDIDDCKYSAVFDSYWKFRGEG